jgi:hypothetical protein
MNQRIYSWRNMFTRDHLPQRKERTRSRYRSLRVEPLEQRRLLSVDLQLREFFVDDDSYSPEVKYWIEGDTSSDFDIGVYRSLEGQTPELLLTTYHATGSDSTPGVWHTVEIPANFEDAPLDYYLMAKLDCYEDVQETRLIEDPQNPGTYIEEAAEDNNLMRFEGGVFLGADRTTKVVGRHVFYDNSAFDGYIPGPNHDPEGDSDDNAIAPDKFALLPGQKATFRNVTSYDKGINGIMIDVFNPNYPKDFRDPGNELGTPDVEQDLTFEKSTPGLTWVELEYGDYLTAAVRMLGEGVVRTTLTWIGGAEPVTEGWLRVTIKADASQNFYNLGHPDVFYFGNLPGDVDGVIFGGGEYLGSVQPFLLAA